MTSNCGVSNRVTGHHGSGPVEASSGGLVSQRMDVLLGVIAIAMVRLIPQVLTPLLEDLISKSGRRALRMMGV